MSEQPLVRLTKKNSSREMYSSHKEQLNTSAFNRESSSGVRREIENNKKEGSKEEDRQGVVLLLILPCVSSYR